MNVVAVVVREVEVHEHERVADLTVRAYAALPGPDHLADGYEAELRDVAGRLDSTVVLVAVSGDDVIGAVTYVPDPRSRWAEALHDGEAAFRALAVDPDAQGHGTGSALLREVIRRATHEGRRAILLHTTPWMETAASLYRRAGFARAPGRDFTADDLPLLAYRLELVS